MAAKSESRNGNGNGNGSSMVSYSTKELFDQIRQSLENIITKMDAKAELAVVNNLAEQIRDRAKQAEVVEVQARLAKLEGEVATKDAVEEKVALFIAASVTTRRWVIALAVPAIVAIVILVVRAVLHLGV